MAEGNRIKFCGPYANLSHRPFIFVKHRRKAYFESSVCKPYKPLWLRSHDLDLPAPIPRCALITRQHSLMSAMLRFIERGQGEL
jgi:hypothetical protein